MLSHTWHVLLSLIYLFNKYLLNVCHVLETVQDTRYTDVALQELMAVCVWETHRCLKKHLNTGKAQSIGLFSIISFYRWENLRHYRLKLNCADFLAISMLFCTTSCFLLNLGHGGDQQGQLLAGCRSGFIERREGEKESSHKYIKEGSPVCPRKKTARKYWATWYPEGASNMISLRNYRQLPPCLYVQRLSAGVVLKGLGEMLL